MGYKVRLQRLSESDFPPLMPLCSSFHRPSRISTGKRHDVYTLLLNYEESGKKLEYSWSKKLDFPALTSKSGDYLF